MTTQDAWHMVRQFALYHGPNWPAVAASESILGRRFVLRAYRGARIPYSDWHAVVRYAFQTSDNGGRVEDAWLHAMLWYSAARTAVPDYVAARRSLDPRMRELADRTRDWYWPVLAPLLPWQALENAPRGGRWDEARWIALLAYNGGPYQPKGVRA